MQTQNQLLLPPDASPATSITATAPEPFTIGSFLTQKELVLSVVEVVFGVVVTLVILRIVAKNYVGMDQGVRGVLVLTIVVSTLVLITSGYSAEAIAPAMGLLGTIAGYLLKDSTVTREAVRRAVDAENGPSPSATERLTNGSETRARQENSQ